MKRLALAVLFAAATMAHAQDPVQAVLQAAPQLVSFAGSSDNFYGLVTALTEGVPGRLASPAVGGFRRVTTLTAGTRLSPAQAAGVLDRARQDLELVGIARPAPEQIGAALARIVPVRVSTALEPERRTPSPDELAFAQLPPQIQSMLRDLPPREALLRVELAQQHLIALGNPAPSVGQLTAMVRYVLASPQAGVYVSASAGATSFPPMSPLVPPYLPAMR